MARIKLAYVCGVSTRAPGTMASFVQDRLDLLKTLAEKLVRCRGLDLTIMATTDRSLFEPVVGELFLAQEEAREQSWGTACWSGSRRRSRATISFPTGTIDRPARPAAVGVGLVLPGRCGRRGSKPLVRRRPVTAPASPPSGFRPSPARRR